MLSLWERISKEKRLALVLLSVSSIRFFPVPFPSCLRLQLPGKLHDWIQLCVALHTGSNDMLEVHKGQANILLSGVCMLVSLLKGKLWRQRNAGLIFDLISDLDVLFPLEKGFTVLISFSFCFHSSVPHCSCIWNSGESSSFCNDLLKMHEGSFTDTHVLGWNVLHAFSDYRPQQWLFAFIGMFYFIFFWKEKTVIQFYCCFHEVPAKN